MDIEADVAGLIEGIPRPLPPALLDALAHRNITTALQFLDHQARGLRAELPDELAPDVDELAAHAALTTLGTSAAERVALIESGYPGPGPIAQTPTTAFLSATADRLPPDDAGRIHQAAHAQRSVLETLRLAERTAPLPRNAPPSDGVARAAEDCGCEDSRAATSPRAFLADLLDYSEARVLLKGKDGHITPVSADLLAKVLQQPFGELTAGSTVGERDASQVRLCIESLLGLVRTGLGSAPDVAPHPLPHSISFVFAADVDGDGRQELVIGFDQEPSSWLSEPDAAGRSGLWVMRYQAGRWRHLQPGLPPLHAAVLFPPGTRARHGFAARFRTGPAGRQQIVLVLEEPERVAQTSQFQVMQYETDGTWSTLAPVTVPVPRVTTAFAADVDGDGLDEFLACGVAPPAQTAGPERKNAFWAYKLSAEAWAPLPAADSPDQVAFVCADPAQWPLGIRLATAGDVNRDGHDEIIALPDDDGTDACSPWIMRYDTVTRQWQHTAPQGNSHDADLYIGAIHARAKALLARDGELFIGIQQSPHPPHFLTYQHQEGSVELAYAGAVECADQFYPLDQAVLADLDGQGREAVVATTHQGRPGSPPTAAWVMARQEDHSWAHLSPIPGHPLGADLEWVPNGPSFASSVIAADVDGDGQDELVFAGQCSTEIWVMHRDAGAWRHLSPVLPHRLDADHVQAAYERLLAEHGTSYEEIRRIRGAPPAERRALAERLGIALGPSRPDALDALRLDPATASQENLEELFGLPSFNRDPLSDGPAATGVKRWSVNGAVWSADPRVSSADQEGCAYLTAGVDPPGRTSITLCSDEARQRQIAQGTGDAKWPVTLTQYSGNGVSATVTLADGAGSLPGALRLFPRLAVWRWLRLRELWDTEDWPQDPYAPQSTGERLPVLDPDLVGPEDFRLPLPKPPGEPEGAFDLWAARRTWLDGRLNALRKKSEEGIDALLDALGAPLDAPPDDAPWSGAPADLPALAARLTTGTQDEVRAAAQSVRSQLLLPVDAFLRLMDLRALAHTGQELTAPEWTEVCSILALAYKQARHPVWLEEETKAGVRLNAATFVTTTRPVPEGAWPPQEPDSTLPLIDPDLVAVTDLPAGLAGAEARDLWRRRAAQITDAALTIRTASSWAQAVDAAFGARPPDIPDWPDWIRRRAAELDDIDPATVLAAQEDIQRHAGDLRPPAFRRLAAVLSKAADQLTVNDSERLDAQRSLTLVRKVKQLYPAWRDEERTGPRPLPYWRARRAALPRWLAPPEARETWRTALASRSRAPVIDPDAVEAQWLHPRSRAAALRVSRATALAQREQDLRSYQQPQASGGLPEFDGMVLAGLWSDNERWRARTDVTARRNAQSAPTLLRQVFGPAADRFDTLLAALDAGGDAAAEARRTTLGELGFTQEEGFRHVMAVRDAPAPSPPSAADLSRFDDLVSRALLLGQATGAQRTVFELGVRLADVLAPLRLSVSAWRRLMELRTLPLSGAPMTHEEFGEAVSIVLRTEKERQFATWREQERGDLPGDRIRRGPDAFTLPDDATTAIPEHLRWRVQQSEMSALRSACRARAEQHRQVLTSMADAVLRTEEAVLPLFRDTLLTALPVPDARTGAQWAADFLLMDTEDAGSRRTTRLGHAIDSVLALLWSLRTGQLRDTYPQLLLDAPTFDADWRWIGSYATWRSAVLVHLYPENLIRPSLRRRRSPAMSAVIEELRDGRITAARARRIAARYGEYLADVCRLDLDPRRMACATVEDAAYSPVMLVRGTGHPRDCTVYIATAPSKRVYWTISDFSSTARGTGFELGFWHRLEQFNAGQVTTLAGTAVYAPQNDPARRRWLYLFAQTQTPDGQGLVFLRYDLDTATWESEPTPLELPEGVSDFTAWITLTAPAHPPRLVIEFLTADQGRPYTERLARSLNATGTAWAQEEFTPLGTAGTWQPLPPGAFDLPGVDSVRQVLIGDFDGNGIDEAAVVPEGGTAVPFLRFGGNRGFGTMDALPVGSPTLVASGRFTDTGPDESFDEVFSLDPGFGQRALRHRYSLSDQAQGKTAWTTFGSDGTWRVPNGQDLPHMLVWPMAVAAGQFEDRDQDRDVAQVAVCAQTLHQDERAGLAVWILQASRHGFVPVSDDPAVTALHHVDPAHDYRGLRATAGQVSDEDDREFRKADDELDVTFRPCPLVKGDPAPPALALTGDFDGDGRDELAIVPAPRADDISRGNDGWVWDLHPVLGWRPLGPVTGGRLRTTWDLGGEPWAVLTAVSGDFDGDGRDELLLLPDTPVGGIPQAIRTLDFQPVLSSGDPAVGTWKELTPLTPAKVTKPVRFAAAADLDGDGSDEVVLVGDDWLRIYSYDKWTKDWIDFPLTGSGLGASAAAVAAGNLDTDHPLVGNRRPRRGSRARGIPDQLIVIGGTPAVHDPPQDAPNRTRALTGTPSPPHRSLSFVSAIRQPSPCAPGWAIPRYADPAGWILDDTVSTRTCAQRSRQAWQDNAAAPATIRRYLEEAFHDLPIAIALALQDSQDYLHALDWFRLVYDYTQPFDRRKTDYGLVLDEHGIPERAEADPKDYARQLLTWVADPLDPHSIAAIRPHTYTRGTLQLLIRCLLDYADSEFTRDTSESVERARILYGTARELLDLPVLNQRLHGCTDVIAELPANTADRSAALLGQLGKATQILSEGAATAGPLPHTAMPPASFCVGPNPVLSALHLHTELNLFKLHTGRNISGMRRELEAYSAPTDQTSSLPTIGADGQLPLPANRTAAPTPYRYTTLLQQAQQLARQAQEAEAAMLAAFEKRDAERLNLVRARQDVQVARATVRLQELRVQQANDRVTLAGLQRNQAQAEELHYQELIDAGENEFERTALDLLQQAVIFEGLAATVSATAAVSAASAGGTPLVVLAAALTGSATAQSLSQIAQQRSTLSSWNSMKADFARARQEWEFRRSIAGYEKRIGEQQVTVETDGVRISEQERTISSLQADNAEAMVEFHLAKFTSAELYDWMSGILERSYRWHLQQATGLAQLAAQQLAFERQEGEPPAIQADYWQAPGGDAFAAPTEDGETGPDRRGLTGSARLLQDITRLSQYAFDTDHRKQQLTKTISLAEIAPLELERLRSDGVTTFATPMRLFDADFPGDYLRMIRRVSVSVIASVPPVAGIRATLSTTGASRIVVGPDVFRMIALRRLPESVSLTAPLNGTGVFTFEPQQQPGMRDPFEELGVDTVWEFRLPRPANPFDYRTLADVQITIDYTALSNADYRTQVVRELDQSAEGERGFSLRHDMADVWWDLHNPDQTDTPLRVRFTTSRADFPPNLDELSIAHVALAFTSSAPLPAELSTTTLRFTEVGTTGALGGTAAVVDRVVSTRRANGGPWLPILGKSPVGNWELRLPDTDEIRAWLADDGLDDALLVLSYRGRTSSWPVG
ncbi:Tc toxin subunit A-related protein [Streptomyces sp. NPDC002758]